MTNSRWNRSGTWLGLLVMAGLSLVLVQCSATPNEPDPVVVPDNPDEPLDPMNTDSLTTDEILKAQMRLVGSSNRFALKLFKALSEAKPDSNICISPLSVAMALGMTYNGADGDTKTAMENTLELAELTTTEINASYRNLRALLTNLDPQVIVQIANSIWYRAGLAVEQDFLDVNREYFDAEVAALNFASADATRTINDWVDDKTNGLINTIIEQIPGDVVMYLINAVYFKGTWMYQFDPEKSYDAEFQRQDGETVPIRMMSQRNDQLGFAWSDSFCAADMPYGNGTFSMTVLVPTHSADINALIGEITPETWDDWMGRFQTREINVEVPRFTLEYEQVLNNVLGALGMEIAFGGGADFSRITASGGLSIDEVRHKTFLEVNEEGTEAAAVTSVSMIRMGPPSVVCNRPFIFAIRENHSGTILFIGKMMDPPVEE